MHSVCARLARLRKQRLSAALHVARVLCGGRDSLVKLVGGVGDKLAEGIVILVLRWHPSEKRPAGRSTRAAPWSLAPSSTAARQVSALEAREQRYFSRLVSAGSGNLEDNFFPLPPSAPIQRDAGGSGHAPVQRGHKGCYARARARRQPPVIHGRRGEPAPSQTTIPARVWVACTRICCVQRQC